MSVKVMGNFYQLLSENHFGQPKKQLSREREIPFRDQENHAEIWNVFYPVR
jgi:hypothetical protein